MATAREHSPVQATIRPSPGARGDVGAPSALFSVLGWEYRRLISGRANWIMLGGTFVVFALLLWLSDLTSGPYVAHGVAVTYTVMQPNTSVWGFLLAYPQFPGLLFGLVLPFVNADGVGRDLQRRTHELLMATELPSWAYVWGRFLAGLMFSTVLACLILLALLVLGAVSHLVDGADYAPVAPGGLAAAWALVVLPVVFLLGGLSFALGTLLPRRSGVVKVGVLLAWFTAGASLWYVLNPTYRDPNPKPAPNVVWDPTSIAPSFPLGRRLHDQLAAHVRTLDPQAFHRYALGAQQGLPDVRSWVGPHVVWMAVGLLVAAIAARAFRRFGGVQM
jgi:ABC-type transport system involved in multi-copper enzyme maturation permease subunit